MKPKLDLFAIDYPNPYSNETANIWLTRYIRARNFRVTRDGALVFHSWPWVRVAAFAPSTWSGGVARLSEMDAKEIQKRIDELGREAE